MRKILVIAPHPDDEIIGCGGTLLKNIEKGNEVYVVFMTYLGDSVREKEAEKVRIKAGIKEIFFLKLKEPLEFNSENLNKLKKIIREINPSIIFLPHENDGDRDHKKTYEIAREAIWMSKINSKGKLNPLGILLYEVHTPMYGVNYYEDISNFINKKIDLLRIYKSQLNHRRYDKAVKSLNSFRGIMGGNTNYAEAFKIKKWSDSL